MLLLISIKCQAIEVYYTDFHGVDEDETTVSHSGGWWQHGDHTGIAHRDIGDYLGTSDTIASRCCTIQKKINITHLLTRVSDDKLHFHLC